MAIDPKTVFENYIPAFSIQNVMLDKMTGDALAAGTVGFYEDLQRLNFKPVYQITGTAPNYTFTQLPNPVPLSLAGDFIDAFGDPVIPYYYPYDDDFNVQLYYVKCLSAGGQLQFEREAQPYFQAVVIPSDTFANTENLISNPQFVQTYFNNQSAFTLTVTGAVNSVLSIAPDWDLIVSGTGTITLQRVALTSTTTPTNPPYVLDINSGGISALTLRQRLVESPRIMSGGFVSAIFIAASQDASTHQLTWNYTPSSGTLDSEVMIQATITNDGTYNVLTGQLEITGILNSDPATTGYVDIDLIIPVGAHIRVSSFQIVGTVLAQDVPYDQETTAQQINRLFHDYQNSMLYMPKETMVPWWNFGLNPRQFFPASNPIATQCSYVFDQTILYQAGGGNKVNVIIGPTASNGNLIVQAASGASDVRFALITYIAPQSVQGSWGYWVSSLLRANLTTTQGSSVRVKVRVIYRTTLPSTIGAAEPIASWAPSTDPTFSAGWTAVAPLNDPAYELAQNQDGTDAGAQAFPAYAFDQMQLPLPTAAATNMIGLVFYTYDALDSTPGDMDVVNIDEISLVPNQFAVASTPLTFDEVSNACKFYYESTYPTGAQAGDVETSNSTLIYTRASAIPGGGETALNSAAEPFALFYSQKATVPNIAIYNPATGTVNSIEAYIYGNGSLQANAANTFNTNWTQSYVGTNRAGYTVDSGTGLTPHIADGVEFDVAFGHILLHATIDSRLGK